MVTNDSCRPPAGVMPGSDVSRTAGSAGLCALGGNSSGIWGAWAGQVRTAPSTTRTAIPQLRIIDFPSLNGGRKDLAGRGPPLVGAVFPPGGLLELERHYNGGAREIK